jgi:hypothetical protein
MPASNLRIRYSQVLGETVRQPARLQNDPQYSLVLFGIIPQLVCSQGFIISPSGKHLAACIPSVLYTYVSP